MFNFQQFMGLGGVATYSVQLRAYSAPFFPKYDEQKCRELNHGGKILLPNSCLDNLVRRHIQWPMLFKLMNACGPQKATHAGVLEFLAEEGRCYLPSWMANQLQLEEGDLVTVEYKSLPNATYAKFKPMSTDFYHITNPRAMLEVELRKFACLTKGDVIAVQYNDQVFEFQVQALKPENAVTIIECDINIEFDAADGYVEPGKQQEEEAKQQQKAEEVPPHGFRAFGGTGFRLDGKKPRTTSTTSSSVAQQKQQQDNKPSTSAAAAGKQGGKASAVAVPSAASTSRPLGATTSAGVASSSSNSAAGTAAAVIVNEQYKPGTLHFVRTPYKSRATLLAEAKSAADDGGGGAGPSGGGTTKPFSGKANTIR